MSTVAKLGIAAIAIIFVGGAAAAAGLYYVSHRASQKFHEAANRITGQEGQQASSAHNSSGGDSCRFLSKELVAQAIGVEIVDARGDDDSCSYFAKGNSGDMAAKHAAKMMGAKGADAKTQKMAEQFGSAIFKGLSQGKPDEGGDGAGNVPVLNLSISDSPSAAAEMKLNEKAMTRVGGGAPGATEDLQIGDKSFVSADSMIMFSKGDKVVRIMYMECPCGTKEVLPLAKQLAAVL